MQGNALPRLKMHFQGKLFYFAEVIVTLKPIHGPHKLFADSCAFSDKREKAMQCQYNDSNNAIEQLKRIKTAEKKLRIAKYSGPKCVSTSSEIFT